MFTNCSKNTTSGLTVAMGYTRMAPHAESRQRRTVRELKRHPGYHWMDTVHDVALLRLDTPVELNRYVGPVCLSTSELNLAGDSSCYVAGWGKTHASGVYGCASTTLALVTPSKSRLHECGNYIYVLLCLKNKFYENFQRA